MGGITSRERIIYKKFSIATSDQKNPSLKWDLGQIRLKRC